MNRKIIVFLVIIAFVVTAGILAVLAFKPSSEPQSNDQNLKIVASTNVWGNIAGQIAHGHATVDSIITSPDADPHLYESSAQDASKVAQADIVIVNGGHYDEFMQSLIDASPKEGRIVIDAAQTMGVDVDHNHAEGVDPHVWYNVPRVNLVANAIKSAVAQKLAAKHDEHLSQHLSEFTASLSAVLNSIEQINTTHPGAPVAYTERVANYVLQAAGLTIKTPASFAAAIEEGNEPSPADQLALESLITNKQIKALIYNSQANSPATERMRALAQQNGIPVVDFTETMPSSAPTYQAWQQSQIDALQKALDNNT